MTIETHPGRGEIYCGNCDLVLGGDNAMTPDELVAKWNTRTLDGVECECVGTIEWQWTVPTMYYEHDLSCGHVVTSVDEEPPNYCEECGAKVRKAVER